MCYHHIYGSWHNWGTQQDCHMCLDLASPYFGCVLRSYSNIFELSLNIKDIYVGVVYAIQLGLFLKKRLFTLGSMFQDYVTS